MVKTKEVPIELKQKVASYIAKHGPRKAARDFDMCQQTVLRIAAGVPATAGTIAVISQALAKRSSVAVPTKGDCP